MTFGEMLRSFRERAKSSQLDLALRSETSQRYVSFLETGRSTPGRDIVRRLARALDLTAEDRDLLLASAGYAPDAAMSADNDLVRKSAARILEQQNPYPALLVDVAQNILATNAGFDAMVAYAQKHSRHDFSELSGPPNILRLCLHERGLFPFIAEPGQFLAAVLGRVLREARGDADALALISEVTAYPHIRALQSSHKEAAVAAVIPERYRIGELDLGFMCLVTSVGVPGSSDTERLRIEHFHPIDDATDRAVQDIMRG
ncbi:MAG: helix-turn-helix transcriptional regulator [Pseudomonadota bacterium]